MKEYPFFLCVYKAEDTPENRRYGFDIIILLGLPDAKYEYPAKSSMILNSVVYDTDAMGEVKAYLKGGNLEKDCPNCKHRFFCFTLKEA